MKILAGVVSATLAIILLALFIPVMTESLADDGHDDALHVFVITGQSNAAYYISDVDVANEMPHIDEGMAYYYGTSSAPMYYGINPSSPTYDTTFESYAIHDMVDSSGDYVIGGLESAFASKYVNETRNKVLMINTAIGGQTISQMQPGQLGNEYAQDVFEHAAALIPSGENVVFESILFIQGESDGATSITAYKNLFLTMADSYMGFTGCDDVVISKVRDGNAANPSVAQIQLCEEYPQFIMATMAADGFTVANSLLTNDHLHYSQAGKNIIGAAMANAVITHDMTISIPLGEALLVIVPICVIAAIILGLVRLIRNEIY